MNLIELSKAYKWNIPTKCPICGSELNLSENHKKLSCTNDYCKSRYSGRITKWTSVLGIKEFGGATIDKFLEAGIIDTISSLYKIDYSKVSSMEGFGEKSAKNLKKEIDSHKEMTLAQFIGGYNIDGISISIKNKQDVEDFKYVIRHSEVDKMKYNRVYVFNKLLPENYETFSFKRFDRKWQTLDEYLPAPDSIFRRMI